MVVIRMETDYDKGMKAFKQDDYKKAEKYLHSSCIGNDSFGCFWLGMIYIGNGKVKADYQKVEKYFNRSCAHYNQLACVMLADMYEKGVNIKQDLIKAKKLYKKACDLDFASGCEEYKRLEKEGK